MHIGEAIYFGQEPPGALPELFAAEIFDHEEGYHSPPVFSDDLTQVYWSPMEHDHGLLYSGFSNGQWSTPVELDFGLNRGVGDPFLSNKGHRLYFLSYEPPDGPSRPEQERIWYADKVNNEWREPVCLDTLLSSHPTHWKGSVSDRGTLYFTSELNMGTSFQDIYYSINHNGSFEPPLPLGPAINTTGWEFGPCISPDESFLIFTREDETTRKTDLYISFRSGDEWIKAFDLGPGINSDGNDLCPSLSPDGKYLFFLSTREGKSRVYWVDMVMVLKSLKKTD